MAWTQSLGSRQPQTLGAQITEDHEAGRAKRVAGGGACVWLTGLSGSGKTTTAIRIRDVLQQRGTDVTLLDGDIVRSRPSLKLGFTRQDRERHVLGVAWEAAEIVRHGGLVICALISPYRALRAQARAIVGDQRFLEVFVDTPAEVCEARDVKGLYRGARRGDVALMTGVDDPYEAPLQPDLALRTVDIPVDDNVQLIVRALAERGFLAEIGDRRA